MTQTTQKGRVVAPMTSEYIGLIHSGWMPPSRVEWVIDKPQAEFVKFSAIEGILANLGIKYQVISEDRPFKFERGVAYFPIGTRKLLRFFRDHFPHFVDWNYWDTPELIETFGKSNVLNADAITTYPGQFLSFDGDDHPQKCVHLWDERDDYMVKPTKAYADFCHENNIPIFKGGVFTLYQLRDLYRTQRTSGLTHKTNIEVSTPKQIDAEYRFFVAGGEIIGETRYALNGEMNISSAVPSNISALPHYFEAIRDTFKAFRNGAFVMDIAATPDGPKIIEVNNFHQSGLYNVDLYKFVQMTQHYLENKYGINIES